MPSAIIGGADARKHVRYEVKISSVVVDFARVGLCPVHPRRQAPSGLEGGTATHRRLVRCTDCEHATNDRPPMAIHWLSSRWQLDVNCLRTLCPDAHSMDMGRELLGVRSPFGHSTIRCSDATDSLDPFGFRPTRGALTTMLNRFAMLAAVCVALPVAVAPLALADPPPPPDPAVAPVTNATNPLPPEGAVPSAPPGVLDTPDGWHLEVSGANETQLPVAPLTTAISSREYLIAGTFTGKITGGGKTKLTGGTLEAGEQIGCGIISDETEINPGASITPGISAIGLPSVSAGISLQGKVYLKPGTVTTVAIDKKSFKGTTTRVTITGVRIKTDQCAGQSFIRSYATLTSSTDNTDDVITYLGVTKSV